MAIKASNQVSLTDVTDAYSVTLTSETFTFMGNNKSGAQVGLSCSTQVIAYCGTQQCSKINVGTIQCPTGISATITNNNTSLPTITFTTTASITEACEATIPVTVDDVTFNKVFSFAVATSVDDSVLELYLQKTETGELKSMIEGIADTINITSRGGLNLSGDRFRLDSTNLTITEDGTVTCSDIYINNGNIDIIAANYSAGTIGTRISDSSAHSYIRPSGFVTKFNNQTSMYMSYGISTFKENGGIAQFMDWENGDHCNISATNIQLLNGFPAGTKKITLNGSNGTIIASGEIITRNANAYRMAYGGNKSTFIRFDGNYYWLLFSDTSTGSYNSLRPLYINASTGLLASNNGQSFSGGTNINGTLSVSNGHIKTTNNVEANGSVATNGGFFGLFIELSSPTPYIDFHKDGSSADYTSRLIENVSGSIYLRVPGGNGWFHAAGYAVDSSKHVKTNIEDISEEEALKLLELRPVSFDYKNGQTNKRGMIGEEVLDVYPELVQVPEDYDEDTFEYNEDGANIVPSLDYAGFVPYLIKMVQIQQREINELKTELSKKSA